ncbi:hypothetical protein [Chryseobacterium sp. JAH]|uniref:hypothetical protein n=1 Tax=Chryseobacterium sp. JAH TaxID=1742858 RepID=UPI0006454A7B|nr:hypothetical protein [Chryseobacterium sp. JAH]KUJ53073.1 hypothetical protein AR685_01415 [Chryseobacterium sp. JAH]
MKIYLTLALLIMSTFIFAQSEKFKKIETTLNEQLKGSYMLRGIYDPPSYSFVSIKIAENGDMTVTGDEKPFTETYSIKNASISADRMRVKIYQSEPRVNITFYVKSEQEILKSFLELQKLLNK